MKVGKNAGGDLFARIARLERTHLVDWIPHIVESEEPEAESILSYSMREAGDDLESTIGVAAHAAGDALLTPGQTDWAADRSLRLVPLPAHLDKVQTVSVARLRYLPRTRLTGAWFAEAQTNGAKWLSLYRGLAAGTAQAGFA